MRFFQTPQFVSKLFPDLEFRVEDADFSDNIYLTFDDGPIPEVTEFVLDCLEAYQAEATFFCVGDNIRKYPEILAKVRQAGHRVGNHTFNHLNGWKSDPKVYLNNVAHCQRFIPKAAQSEKALFRPPYGKITQAQRWALQSDYRLIMWEVLTYDFDAKLSPERCLEAAIKATKAGSIVVFHDSVKSWKNLQYVLPRYLAYFAQRSYQFKAL